MRIRSSSLAGIAVASVVVFTIGATVVGHEGNSSTTAIHACTIKDGQGALGLLGEINLAPRDAAFKCPTGSVVLHWNKVGPKGDTGAKGDPGPKGAAGAVGPQGDTGARGAKGDAGPQGPTGERGPAGDPGAQGDRGPAGDAGPKGDRGPQGDTGVKGDDGKTGDTGPVGDTGPRGPQGDPGAAGAQGPQGDTGATGAKGDRGDTGSQGPKGDTGAAGTTNIRVRTTTGSASDTTVSASCNAGEVATGGGAYGSEDKHILQSYPLKDGVRATAGQVPNGWFINQGIGTGQTVTVYVLCAG